MAIVQHPSTGGNRATARAVDSAAVSSDPLPRSKYQSLIRIKLRESRELRRMYGRAACDLAFAMVGLSNYDDQSEGRLRLWHGYAETGERHGRRGYLDVVSRSTMWRATKLLCGEVAGVPGIMSRRPACDGEIITRQGEIVGGEFHAKPNQRLSYIYTFDPPERFALTDEDKRKRRKRDPVAVPAPVPPPARGFEGRIITGGFMESPASADDPVQGVLPPAPLVATSAAASFSLELLRTYFAEFSALYPKPYRINSEGWNAWREIVTSEADAQEVIAWLRSALSLGGTWADLHERDKFKPGDRGYLPKPETFLLERRWLTTDAIGGDDPREVFADYNTQRAIARVTQTASLLAPSVPVERERGTGFTSAAALSLLQSVETFGIGSCGSTNSGQTIKEWEREQARADREHAKAAKAEDKRCEYEYHEMMAEMIARDDDEVAHALDAERSADELACDAAQRARELEADALRVELDALNGQLKQVRQALSDNGRAVAKADPLTLEPTPELQAERAQLQGDDAAVRAQIEACKARVRALGFVCL